MYICEQCHVFETPIRLRTSERLECHGRECYLPDEDGCPFCGREYAEAKRCPICGKWYPEDEGDICPECLKNYSDLAFVFGYIILKYTDKEKASFIDDIISDDKDAYIKYILEVTKNE